VNIVDLGYVIESFLVGTIVSPGVQLFDVCFNPYAGTVFPEGAAFFKKSSKSFIPRREMREYKYCGVFKMFHISCNLPSSCSCSIYEVAERHVI